MPAGIRLVRADFFEMFHFNRENQTSETLQRQMGGFYVKLIPVQAITINTDSKKEMVETSPKPNGTPTLRYENNQSDLITLKTEETVPFREKGPAESHPGTHGSEGYSHKEGFNMVLII